MSLIKLTTLVLAALYGSTVSAAMTAEEYQAELQRTEKASAALPQNQRPSVSNVENKDCRDAWNLSSASQSCTTRQVISQDPAGTCNLYLSCKRLNSQTRALPDWKTSVNAASWQYDEAQRTEPFFPAPYPYVKLLVNCDGVLQYGSCQ
ncbi:hypothetical protein [Pseudomonas frederiksbergensis]|uniref:hypothetical protein n=1 Tax=Pseudomonas frederiksbergensis TaxID=104087 RepID=UPI0011CD6D0F|nr:hypothetical protein [Pseudomonas frederiksbergensis]